MVRATAWIVVAFPPSTLPLSTKKSARESAGVYMWCRSLYVNPPSYVTSYASPGLPDARTSSSPEVVPIENSTISVDEECINFQQPPFVGAGTNTSSLFSTVCVFRCSCFGNWVLFWPSLQPAYLLSLRRDLVRTSSSKSPQSDRKA